MNAGDDDGASGGAPAPSAISPLSGPQGQWATQFVQVALKTALGPIVQVVGDSLMSRGAQSLDELHRHTQLDIPTLKRALLSLIQQDLAMPAYERIPPRQGAAPAAAPKKPRPPRVLYSLNVESLRHRTRHAQYLQWIKLCFGPECEYIMQTLLVHGKLSSAQVMQLTFASISEKNRLAAQEAHRVQVQNAVAAAAAAGGAAVKPPPPPPPPAPSAFDRRRIHDVFRQLIASRYIRRAQGLVPPEAAAAAAAKAAADAAAGTSGGSSSLNNDILQTFLANSAAAQAKQAAAEEEAAAARAASGAQAALKAATAASVAAAQTAAAGSRKRKKINVDDEEDGATEGDAAAATGGKAKKAKKKTKKELEAEAREAKLAEIAAAREKEQRDTEASLDRAAQAAAAASSSSSSGGAAGAEDTFDDSSLHGDAHILWSVNHDQFLWEFRKKAVIDHVAAAHSPACSFLVAQMLLHYPPDCCARQGGERPRIIDIPEIVRLCNDAAAVQNIDSPVANSAMAEECIHQLLGDASGFFERKSHPVGYLINFQSLFSALRLLHIQSLCRSRYGSLSARIFRCLLTSARLEETQLSELCTAPRKEVRRLLYELYAARLVSLQEVPRTSDRMPQKTFYLWGVDREAVCQRYLDTLYFSWCNLRLRSAHETDAAKSVLDKVDTSRRITPDEKAQVERWKKAADRLEIGMHSINQNIMLFQDF